MKELLHFSVWQFLPLLVAVPSEALTTCLPQRFVTQERYRRAPCPPLYVTSNNANRFQSDKYEVRVSPASSDGPDPSDPLVFHDNSPISLTAQPYSGHLCRTVGEAMDRVLRDGFAVFESEDAMFAIASAGDELDEEREKHDDDDNYFNARWMKETPRDSVDFRGLRKKDILYGACKPFAAFARRLHYGITTHRSSHSSPTDEEFIGAICLCSPITRGLSLNNNNVYSMHQDPCFFTSLFDRHRKLQAEIAELEAEIAAGLQDDDDDYDDDDDDDYYDDDDDDDDDEYNDGPMKEPLSEKVISTMEEKADQLSADSNLSTIHMRQVNFWLPHSPNGDKHLVFLTREASAALASYRIRAPHDDNSGEPGQETHNGRTVDSGNEDGDLWVTERGLNFIREEMPDHVFVTNRPLVFVSGNSEDPTDPLFHCGAVITGRGAEDGDTEALGDKSCSSEIRIAVCSTKKKTDKVTQ